jgi:hypothetical protein
MYLKPPALGSENPKKNNAFNEDSDSQDGENRDDLDSSERKRERMNESANESNVPLMERLSATFKKRKLNSTNKANSANGSADPRSNRPITSEQLFIVSRQIY